MGSIYSLIKILKINMIINSKIINIMLTSLVEKHYYQNELIQHMIDNNIFVTIKIDIILETLLFSPVSKKITTLILNEIQNPFILSSHILFH